MKKSILFFASFFLAVRILADQPSLAQTIHYACPTNFYLSLLEGEPHSDNPFFMDGSPFLYYLDKNDRYGLVRVQLCIVGAYVGEGKIVKFLPTEPSDLKKYMGTEYEKQFPQETPVAIGKIDGLTTVCLTAERPPGQIRPYFFHFCWIQIETNIVVKISVYSCNLNSFSAVTNSFQSIKIDKTRMLELVKTQ